MFTLYTGGKDKTEYQGHFLASFSPGSEESIQKPPRKGLLLGIVNLSLPGPQVG